jgi:phosphatidylinositol glycan anchor class Y biosynthesis protein
MFDSLATSARGYLLILVSVLGLCAHLYATILSKLLPTPSSLWLAAISQDTFYCYLIPLLLPIFFIFIYFNWLGLKLFRHN